MQKAKKATQTDEAEKFITRTGVELQHIEEILTAIATNHGGWPKANQKWERLAKKLQKFAKYREVGAIWRGVNAEALQGSRLFTLVGLGRMPKPQYGLVFHPAAVCRLYTETHDRARYINQSLASGSPMVFAKFAL